MSKEYIYPLKTIPPRNMSSNGDHKKIPTPLEFNSKVDSIFHYGDVTTLHYFMIL